jgi:hypothetical protein
MKNIDITRRVMRKVAGFERQRIASWVRYFIIVVIVLTGAFSVLFAFIIRDLLEKRTLDLLELFTQDPEIIVEFWGDVVSTFWAELPQELFLVLVLLLMSIIMVCIMTRRKRLTMQKKIRQLDKYS